MKNGIISFCNFNNNIGHLSTLFLSSSSALISYSCAINNSQNTITYRGFGKSLESLQSNFSHTNSEFQGCLSSSSTLNFIQKYVNFYKCGKDWGGASLTVYIGKGDISYSNFIDIESTGKVFMFVGAGSETLIKSCLFEIKGFKSFLGLYGEKNTERVYLEDCNIIGDITHDMPYLSTKNVIFDSTKSDYTFVNIPFLTTDIINFEISVFYHCKFFNLSFFLFVLII